MPPLPAPLTFRPPLGLPSGFIPGRPINLPGTNNIVRFRLPSAVPTPPLPPPLLPAPWKPSIPGVNRVNPFDIDVPRVNPFFPLLGPPVFAPNETLFYTPPESTLSFVQLLPVKPESPEAYSLSNIEIFCTGNTDIYINNGTITRFTRNYSPALKLPLIAKGLAAPELRDRPSTSGPLAPHQRGLEYYDRYGNTTIGVLPNNESGIGLTTKPRSAPVLNNQGVAAPTAPTAPPTPSSPPAVPNSPPAPQPNPLPGGVPTIVPFPRKPQTPPAPQKSPSREPEPEPAPNPPAEPQPPAPEFPPSDPEAPPAPKPEPPPRVPTPTPPPTRSPDKAPPPQESPPAEPQPRVPTPVKVFVKCDKGKPEFGTETVLIPGNSISYVSKIFDRIAKIEGQQCTKPEKSDCDCIATVPEWWQLRPEAQRPQAILLFRELKNDGTIGNDRYSITVPHCTLTKPPQSPPLSKYKKGNFEGILTLKDNSKLIVNCIDSKECEAVIGELSKVINPDYLEGSSQKIGKRLGLPFKQIEVVASGAHYYPEGVKNMKPAYIKSFR